MKKIVVTELSGGRENPPTGAAQEWPSFADAYAALYINMNLTRRVMSKG
jgi:hypothetical protein